MIWRLDRFWHLWTRSWRCQRRSGLEHPPRTDGRFCWGHKDMGWIDDVRWRWFNVLCYALTLLVVMVILMLASVGDPLIDFIKHWLKANS